MNEITLIILIVGITVVITVVTLNKHNKSNNQRLEVLNLLIEQLSNQLSLLYLVESCSRCHETKMELIEVSKTARSIHYKCVGCGKKKHSPAGSPNATESINQWNKIVQLANEYQHISEQYQLVVEFQTPAAPLPYEQTTRTPIPEAVRSEIWRRDQGKCVKCGSNQNLQYDHIIPVSRGGATSVKNLQLLCQQCNSKKGARI